MNEVTIVDVLGNRVSNMKFEEEYENEPRY